MPTRIPIITDVQLIEGLIASIFFPIAALFFRRFNQDHFIKYSSVTWFATWIMRKFAVNMYMRIKNKHHKPVHMYHITVPFSL